MSELRLARSYERQAALRPTATTDPGRRDTNPKAR